MDSARTLFFKDYPNRSVVRFAAAMSYRSTLALEIRIEILYMIRKEGSDVFGADV